MKYVSLKSFYANTSDKVRDVINDLLDIYNLNSIVDLEVKYHEAADRKALAARWTSMGAAELVSVFESYAKAADDTLDSYLIALNKVEEHKASIYDPEVLNAIRAYVVCRLRFPYIRKYIKRNDYDSILAYCSEKLASACLSAILHLPENEREDYSNAVVRNAASDHWKKNGDQPLLIDPVKTPELYDPSATDHWAEKLDEFHLSKKVVCIRKALLKMNENDRHLLVAHWLHVRPRHYASFSRDVWNPAASFGHLLDGIPMSPCPRMNDAKYISNHRAVLVKRFHKNFEQEYRK